MASPQQGVSDLQPESSRSQEPDMSDDEHFSDASEGHQHVTQAVPTTVVEKSDARESHGEVPGTAAYNLRRQDAQPDQVEVVGKEGQKNYEFKDQDYNRSETPGQLRPKTKVEKVDAGSSDSGEVPRTTAWAKRRADAKPDEVTQRPGSSGHSAKDEITERSDDILDTTQSNNAQADVGDEPDDFDDFNEGVDDGDDFNAFHTGWVDGSSVSSSTLDNFRTERVSQSTYYFQAPLIQFGTVNTAEELENVILKHSEIMFPRLTPRLERSVLSDPATSFLSERSESLWSQLVAPPPLQPPSWVRSRIRRLFLVSLGVPVDLDEILPASKQKRLILPSSALDLDPPTRHRDAKEQSDLATDHERNNKTTLAPGSIPNDRQRRKPEAPPGFDASSARLLCSTTAAAMANFTDSELQNHTLRLEELKHRASEALEYWLVLKDNAKSEKEAFEEVIENLVKHARKFRK